MLRRSFLSAAAAAGAAPHAVVLISANAEWAPAKRILNAAPQGRTPYGEFFIRTIGSTPVVFNHGGWGKVDAAASTQYAIDRWNPRALINLGTCGGMEGQARAGDILLAARTVIYDIVERMGDSAEAIRDYSTPIDLAWLHDPLPPRVRKATLVSADSDLDPAAIPRLRQLYSAVAADWESGAIARVAARNSRRLVILRGVTDVVSSRSGEAYGNFALFERRAEQVMRTLLEALPWWLQRALASPPRA